MLAGGREARREEGRAAHGEVEAGGDDGGGVGALREGGRAERGVLVRRERLLSDAAGAPSPGPAAPKRGRRLRGGGG